MLEKYADICALSTGGGAGHFEGKTAELVEHFSASSHYHLIVRVTDAATQSSLQRDPLLNRRIVGVEEGCIT
jgi:hypothetical protein